MEQDQRCIRDPIELAIFQSSVHSIAEEMGAALRRTVYLAEHQGEARLFLRAL